MKSKCKEDYVLKMMMRDKNPNHMIRKNKKRKTRKQGESK